MALVNVASVGLLDFTGNPKTIPLYVDTSLSLANIQTLMNTFVTDLDPVVDSLITGAQINLALTLPSGLKTAAVAGNTVREGADITYDAANTTFVYTAYIPSWNNAGFAGNIPLNTGIYATLIDDLISLSITDKNGNALTSYLRGKRAFRK